MQLSALFHEGGQISALINLATLPPAGLLRASVPSCSPACEVFGLGWPGFAPVWLFLSCQRPLNQEGALSAPCSCDVFCSQSRPQGGRMLRTARLSHFDVTFVVRDHRFITLAAMMVPCWRQMHAQSAMVQSQAEPSWQEGSDIQFLL